MSISFLAKTNNTELKKKKSIKCHKSMVLLKKKIHILENFIRFSEFLENFTLKFSHNFQLI